MSKVRPLPEYVVSKIAAGEVIDRPASVVKELLENALDASSDSIEIRIKNAGKKLIAVKDSGSGIEPDDIEKIFLRHSTSKISDISDLYAVSSFGFRGEALYSIAAIADVVLRSRTPAADTGFEIHVRGGAILDVRPVAMASGTEIEVSEIFFNTPARRKFLKTDNTELNHILNMVTPYALLYPQVPVTLNHGSRMLIDIPGGQTRLDRVEKLLRLKRSHLIEMDPVELDIPGVSVSGVLGDVNIQRARRDMQFIFVNNRPVSHRNISFHMNRLYRMLMPARVSPFFFIHLEVPPQGLDVNIHPAKREVKIKDEYSIISRMTDLCQKALTASGPKQIRVPSGKPMSFPGAKETSGMVSDDAAAPQANEAGKKTPFASPVQYVLDNPSSGDSDRIFSPPPGSKPRTGLTKIFSRSRYIGSFLKKYLLFESGESLLVVDQHAAQERVTYEQLKRQVDAGALEVQNLLAPVLIRLSVAESILWEKAKESFARLGFTTTRWDQETIALHSVPQLISNGEKALRNLLGCEDDPAIDNLAVLAKRACHQSLKTGYQMSLQQAQYLRTQLLRCQTPLACPHGRPTVIEIQDKEFQRYFLRR